MVALDKVVERVICFFKNKYDLELLPGNINFDTDEKGSFYLDLRRKKLLTFLKEINIPCYQLIEEAYNIIDDIRLKVLFTEITLSPKILESDINQIVKLEIGPESYEIEVWMKFSYLLDIEEIKKYIFDWYKKLYTDENIFGEDELYIDSDSLTQSAKIPKVAEASEILKIPGLQSLQGNIETFVDIGKLCDFGDSGKIGAIYPSDQMDQMNQMYQIDQSEMTISDIIDSKIDPEMNIEKVVEMINDSYDVANTKEEAQNLIQVFTKNFNNEYMIIRKNI